MRIWKVTFLIMNLILLILIGSGCWNYNEINDKAIVAGVAFDPGIEKKYLVTVEIVNPSSQGAEAQMSSVIIGMEGDSVFDAIRNLIAKVGKKLYWSHAKIMIINEELAREGIRPLLDMIYRDPEVRLDILLLVSKEKTAWEIFHGDGEINQIRSFQYGNIMRASSSLSKVFPTELWNYLTFLYFEGADPVVPGIRFAKKPPQDNQAGGGKEEEKDGGGKGGDTEDEKKEIEIFESAIFNGDKLIGWIPADRNKFLLWAWNVYNQGVVVINNVLESDTDVTIEVIFSQTRVLPKLTDSGLQMNVDIQLRAMIAEVNGGVDVIEEGKQKDFEKEAEEFLKTEMTSFIQDMQKVHEADIFDFGLMVKRQMPDYWKQIKEDWPEIYSNLKTQVKVDIDIVGSGMVLKPIKVVE